MKKSDYNRIVKLAHNIGVYHGEPDGRWIIRQFEEDDKDFTFVDIAEYAEENGYLTAFLSETLPSELYDAGYDIGELEEKGEDTYDILESGREGYEEGIHKAFMAYKSGKN